jgi:hypothetical protein
MELFRLCLAILFCSIVLAACGEDAVEMSAPAPAPAAVVASDAVQTDQVKPASTNSGGVSVKILPDNPTSTGCLRAVVHGIAGRSTVLWSVNNDIVSSGTNTQLCSEHVKRGDQVSVEVGTQDKGAVASVSIANSPPKVVEISSVPEEIFAGSAVTVTPIAEDVDGDDVSFTYQWLINGEADSLLSEATLPANSFTKGDTIQVQIVPNDFFEDGPTYESYAQPIPNASPRITSEPPQGIASLDYRYQVVANDPDDNQLAYSLSDAPEGMFIDENGGLIEWSLVNVTPGDYIIAIKVSDSEGAEAVQEYRLSLGAPE